MQKLSRRDLLKISGAAAAGTVSPSFAAAQSSAPPVRAVYPEILREPDSVVAFTDDQTLPLTRQGQRWNSGPVAVELTPRGTGAATELAVAIEAPGVALQRVRDRPIRIGISQCLLGEQVRFDGGHKLDRFITNTLGQYFEWISVCPEVELGLGTPRETLRLVQLEEGIGLVMPKSGRDWSREMNEYAKNRVAKLAGEDLAGYILKSDSPSCGVERVRVYAPSGMSTRKGIGLFARELLKHFPDIPIEEEGRLSDPRLRQNWVERVFAYHRLRVLWESKWTIGDLVEFHTAHKLVLMAHSPKAFADLGRLVAGSKQKPRQELCQQYQTDLMAALKVLATRGRHANVLQHMAGYFKKQLDDESRQELQDHITDYRKGYLPLIVPVTLIKHYVRQFGVSFLAGQVYLNPHPKELALLNHV